MGLGEHGLPVGQFDSVRLGDVTATEASRSEDRRTEVVCDCLGERFHVVSVSFGVKGHRWSSYLRALRPHCPRERPTWVG